MARCLDLPPDNRLTFGPLITKARDAGILNRSPRNDAVWDELLAIRNKLVHGDADAPLYGMTTHSLIGKIIDLVSELLSGETRGLSAQ